MGAQLRAVEVFAHDIGDQAFVARLLAGDDHGLAHTGAGAQGGLDLAQFDAEAAQFDLRIVASEEIQLPIGTPTRQIAAAVHARTRSVGKGIGDEALCGQVGAIQIPLCKLRTGDVQFADHADGDRLSMPIEHVQAAIGERFADRHAPRWIRGGVQRQCGDELRALGRAIGLQYAGLTAGGQYPSQGMRIGDIATGDEQTQCAQLWRDQWRVRTQHAGDQNQYR